MELLKNAIMYFLSFKSYVLLPIIIFILAMVFRIKLETAVRSAFTIGIGFIGIFIVFDYFAGIVTPVVQSLVKNMGMNFTMVDLGWPPLAGMTWSFMLAPVMLLLVIVLNIILLLLKITKTVDIDIWNYWHFIFTSALVYDATKNVPVSIAAGLTIAVLVLKFADWSAPMVNKFSGMQGICTPTLSSAAYFPYAIVMNKLMNKIPGFNKIDANPEKIKERMGLFGDPMIIGFVIGVLLGIGGGYNIKSILELAMGFSAVIYILPKMCGILGSGLVPISEGMKNFINKRFPSIGQTYIALDIAIIVGQPSVVVTSLLLMPVALFLAFTLPGVKFIPIGDLVNLMGSVALITVASRSNVIRSFFISIPVVIGNLYTASAMGYVYTNLASSMKYKVADYSGVFTSYLDGGNLLRIWIVKLFSGDIRALIILPFAAALIYFARMILIKDKLME